MKKVLSATLRDWHTNTDLSVNLKTTLCIDARMTTGKDYLGVLRRDSDTIVDDFLYRDPHYTFVETAPLADGKRNPRIFDGKHISITVRPDGSPRPNFKTLYIDPDFSIDDYADAVRNELCQGLRGLLEK